MIVITKLIVLAYGLSAGIAAISDSLLTALVAGCFGLTGITLQLVFSWRTGRIERAADEAKAAANETSSRVDVNAALLEERRVENEALHRRVEQLIAVLAAEGRTIPDERGLDVGPPGPERRQR